MDAPIPWRCYAISEELSRMEKNDWAPNWIHVASVNFNDCFETGLSPTFYDDIAKIKAINWHSKKTVLNILKVFVIASCVPSIAIDNMLNGGWLSKRPVYLPSQFFQMWQGIRCRTLPWSKSTRVKTPQLSIQRVTNSAGVTSKAGL